MSGTVYRDEMSKIDTVDSRNVVSTMAKLRDMVVNTVHVEVSIKLNNDIVGPNVCSSVQDGYKQFEERCRVVDPTQVCGCGKRRWSMRYRYDPKVRLKNMVPPTGMDRAVRKNVWGLVGCEGMPSVSEMRVNF